MRSRPRDCGTRWTGGDDAPNTCIVREKEIDAAGARPTASQYNTVARTYRLSYPHTISKTRPSQKHEQHEPQPKVGLPPMEFLRSHRARFGHRLSRAKAIQCCPRLKSTAHSHLRDWRQVYSKEDGKRKTKQTRTIVHDAPRATCHRRGCRIRSSPIQSIE